MATRDLSNRFRLDSRCAFNTPHNSQASELRFTFANDKRESHPFHVKSDWKPPVTQSVVLESYLDEVKLDLSAATFTKPKDNLIGGPLTEGERKALKDLLKNNTKMLIKP